jgi:hypothetical protein
VAYSASKIFASISCTLIASSVVINYDLNNPAHSAIIEYRIDGFFETGSLAGLSYSELFTFDDSTRPSVLGSVPWITEILSYSLEVPAQPRLDTTRPPKSWSLNDWPMEHTFSQWIDTSGFLNSYAYLATPGPAGFPPAISSFLDDGAPNSRSKHVKWYDWSVWNTYATDSKDLDPTVQVVPGPVPILGIASAFGFSRKLRKRIKLAPETD